MRRHAVKYITLLLGIALLCPGPLRAEESISREYKIKAAYLFNLIKFVNWPSGAQKTMNSDGETRICVFGDNPFAQHLEKLTTRKAKGRGIDINYVDGPDIPSSCNIVFIAASNADSAQMLTHSAEASSPPLTVGENASFVDSGGIVGLGVEDNSVQLQINLTQAKKTGFEISGNLLEIAEVVK